MAAGDKKYLTNDTAGNDVLLQTKVFPIGGDLADATTYTFRWVTPKAITITDLQVSLSVSGVGGTDVEVDLKDDAVSVLTTLPSIAVAAGADEIARVGGGAATGVVHTVLNASLTTIAAGSTVLVSIVADGTFSPQPNDLTVVVEYKEQQDFDPQPT